MHIDWQHWAALAIVAVAAWVVGRRLWVQIAAFRGRPARRKASGSRVTHPAPARPDTLIQIQLTPPRHMKRPPADGERENP